MLSAVGFVSSLQTAASWSPSPRLMASSVPHLPPWLPTRPIPPTSSFHLTGKTTTAICHSLPADIADRTELEVLTVKELRQRIKDWGLQSRGLSGKRKAELIDYIMVESVNDKSSQTRNDDSEPFGNENNGIADFEKETAPKQVTKRRAATMPPLTTSLNGEDPEVDGSHSITENGGNKINPEKAKIYRDVLKQYPPLQDIMNPDTLEHVDPTGIQKPDGVGEHDIRHAHHPMLKGMRYSDLDVVFVGTASCTPGMTRGVSCTALRLQWRRKRGHVLGTKNNDRNINVANLDADLSDTLRPDGRYDESGSFSGGIEGSGRTWLFDCGESTQVSLFRLFVWLD